jgi:hypothetical protein
MNTKCKVYEGGPIPIKSLESESLNKSVINKCSYCLAGKSASVRLIEYSPYM